MATENAAGNIPDFNVKVYHTERVIDCDKKHVSLLIRSACVLARFRQNVKMKIYYIKSLAWLISDVYSR